MNMLQMALGAGLATTIAEDEKKKRERNIIEIPDNATNGEVFKMIFGNDLYFNFILSYEDPKWWNEPYKEGSEDK